YALSSTEWWDETVSPRGYENLEGFRLENGMPVFSFLIAGHLLEKRIWMEHGENTTWASYSWPETASAALLSIKLFFAQRSFHASQHGDPNNWHWKYGFSGDTVWTLPWDGARKTVVKASHLTRVSVEAQWYWGFF